MSHSQEPEWLKYQSHGVWVVCWCHVKIITFPSYLLQSENRKLHDWLTICWNHFRLKDHSVDVWTRKPDKISLCLCLFFCLFLTLRCHLKKWLEDDVFIPENKTELLNSLKKDEGIHLSFHLPISLWKTKILTPLSCMSLLLREQRQTCQLHLS